MSFGERDLGHGELGIAPDVASHSLMDHWAGQGDVVLKEKAW